jgi:hypothetical protein
VPCAFGATRTTEPERLAGTQHAGKFISDNRADGLVRQGEDQQVALPGRIAQRNRLEPIGHCGGVSGSSGTLPNQDAAAGITQVFGLR